MKSISELRQDIVSGDWVVIATGRAKRPDQFIKDRQKKLRQKKQSCPFETVSKNALLVYPLDGMRGKEKWWVEVVKNLYPAFGEGVCGFFYRKGIYRWTEGVGLHELVVTRDHDRSPGQMSQEEIELMIRAYQDRFRAAKENKCIEYVSIFHNHGREAGATLYHSHSQIIALPVIPPDVGRSLSGSARYYKKNHRCVHCALIRYELQKRDRIIYKNDSFALIAPFASKSAFEMRIFPLRHQPRFEEISASDRLLFADALKTALSKLFRGLKDPDYNFFLHTSPTKREKNFHHYHWHLEIIPKTSVWAGFEIGTGIEISTIAPEAAAAFFRRIRV